MKATATELNKRPGKYLAQAIKGPVVIEKSGRPVVVIVSCEHYIQLEDAYWKGHKEKFDGVAFTFSPAE